MATIIGEGLTFDDVLLVPQASSVLPHEVSLKTRLTKNIELNVPILSAAMDTVTESELAIAIAREGGIGFIHKNMTIERQAEEVEKVKRYESGMIANPVTLTKNATLREANELLKHYKISGLPVIEKDGSLIGIITNRDLKYRDDLTIKVKDIMTKENLVTAPVGTTLEEAKQILLEHRIEKLPIVKNNKLKGLITIKDIDNIINYPNAAKDEHGRLRVGAAVGIGKDTVDRISALVKAGVDVVTVDSAHGHSKGVVEAIKKIRKKFPKLDLIGGNIVTKEAAADLIKAGVDAVKVGIGPGSICTTRVVSGVGVPQVSAVMEVYDYCKKHEVSVIADGGITLSGDIVKAIASGADCVMLGSLLAGTEEAPGEEVLFNGRKFKTYVGMGSLVAMKRGSKDRYFQLESATEKLVPEGIESMVPFKGRLKDTIYQLCGGLRSGMGYCGTPDIESLKSKSKFIKITNAGLKESHPHDVIVTKEAPNYQASK
ncbi:Inosine-5'-monophosphate dehydrogenase [Sebaldella termitidis]|jgi:IMP dehydrogenase|uniref:Inosine-5'-monophosphate dehydrogenase n=1 Tax=Sebaldella termitidis (strain ATCC 33386 / NCTC 11300) TaxID=526218 RepID=D1AI31_SEBTE|nr:IMP dehydrogenase [Sebaldella termitidis]ACZ08415.1 inosine-5'-monophosphate dehydrogenase [Sebaldella termitidis ATCC 33386]SUI23728.1 Inosine-5'-monophosphate dehydrogenase [Sebaldella termitidis]